jgi:ABC-type long-subunit fatty acid transport system fused permease/ATPase subunit
MCITLQKFLPALLSLEHNSSKLAIMKLVNNFLYETLMIISIQQPAAGPYSETSEFI